MGSGAIGKGSWGIITVAALGATVGAIGCKSASADAKHNIEEPITKVETVAVTQQETPQFLTLTGTLVANQKADVAADAVGKVQRAFVERGTFVAKGAILVIVDGRSAALRFRFLMSSC